MRFRLKKLNSRGVAHHALVALIVVVAFASFGAYRVFSTKAFNFNGDQQQTIRKADGCVPGKHVKNGTCQKFDQVATIQSDCSGNKVEYDASTQSCKDKCVSGYQRFYGECVTNDYNTSGKPADVKAACDARGGNYNATKNTCSGGTSAPNCGALNRSNGSANACGPCKSGYVDTTPATNTDACEAQAQCNGNNTQYDASRNTCVCKSGFERVNGNCVATGTNPPANQNCPSGKVKINGTCETKVNCSGANTQYRADKNDCVCISGYERNAAKDCVKAKTGTTPGPTDQTPHINCGNFQTNKDTNKCETTKCVVGYFYRAADKTCVKTATDEQIKASCEKQHRVYADGKCGSTCQTGYFMQNGICSNDPNSDPAKVEADCKAKNQVYDKNKNICKSECQVNYFMSGTTCVKATDAQLAMVKTCNAQHRFYDQQKNKCKDECLTGFKLNDKKACVEDVISPEKQKSICQAQGLQYNAAANACKDACIIGYAKKDGKCVSRQATATVTTICDPVAEECTQVCEATPTDENCTVTTTAPIICNPKKDKCSKDCEKNNTPETCTVTGQPQDPNTVPQTEPGKPVRVDDSIGNNECALLGRDWVEGTRADGTGVNGCALTVCLGQTDTVIPNNGHPYCKDGATGSAYASQISQDECNALHRKWLASAGVCAQVPVAAGKTDKFVNAPQCVSPYTTYVVHDNGQGECYEKTIVDRIQRVAEMFGSTFDAVLHAGPEAFCAAQSGHYWSSGEDECRNSYPMEGFDPGDPKIITATVMGNDQILLDMDPIVSLAGPNYTVSYKNAQDQDVPVSCYDVARIGYGHCFIFGLTSFTTYSFDIKIQDKLIAYSTPATTATACVAFDLQRVDANHVKVSWGEVPGADFYSISFSKQGSLNDHFGPNESYIVDTTDMGQTTWRVNSHSAIGYDYNKCAYKNI